MIIYYYIYLAILNKINDKNVQTIVRKSVDKILTLSFLNLIQ